MRKTWIIAVAAAAVALAGCNREAQAPEAARVFRAAIETPSRVAFSDEGAFSWQAGDAVALSTNAGFKTFTLASGAGASVAAFDGDLSGVTSATVAIYPASIAKDDATVTLPAEYAWAEGQTNAAMFCSQVSLTEVNSFKHLGGIIKVTFAEIPAEADAMVLKAEAKITGDFAIADGKIAAGVGSDQVKVTFAAGSNPAAFYIPVPTGEYKFAVELQAAGATIEKSVKATTNAIKIDRKALVMMDPVGGPVKISIATAEDFMAFVPDANDLPAGSEATLTADITLPDTFIPDSLGCNFDGQGHKVTFNLDIPAEAEIPVGLFCNVAEGLTVKNLKVAGNIKCAKQNVGGVAGKSAANVTFENCESEVNILGVEKQTYHMGGICGDSATGVLFKGCHNKGALTINMGSSVTNTCQTGGIVGHIEANGAMEDCVNDGEILFDAAGTARIGGMVGYINKVVTMSYKNCVNNANLTSSGKPASGYAYVGGISGYYGTAGNGSVVSYENCENNGKIEATEGALQTRMGGIVSHGGSTASGVSMTWTLKDCTNNGDVISAGTVAKNHLGGVISMVETSATLICENLTNNAKVSLAGIGVAAGILGSTAGLESTFKNVNVTAKSVIETKGAGTVGVIIGSPALKTAITGKVGAATHGKNGTETVLTAANYQDFLVGAALGEGGSTEGVVFDGPAVEPTPATIADFAKEYVKILDVWQATTGEIVMHKDVPEETVANAHYVPETTTITVGGKEYNTADMFETALRSYLLIRGYNGLETEKYGKNSIPALEGGAVAMSTTEVPATHDYYWGEWPYNETSGNGGHLVLGTKDENEHCKVKTDILDNWAMRSLNFQHGKAITNLCGYSNNQLAGYYGCFCSKRALLTYAFFFKYMLDNNLDKGTDVADDVIIRSELLGDETAPVVPVQKDTTYLARWWFDETQVATLKVHFDEAAKITVDGASVPNPDAMLPGNGGYYVEPNVSGSGRIEFYNGIDKSGINPKGRVKRVIGKNGGIVSYGTWKGDYYLLTANTAEALPAGTDIYAFFALRPNVNNVPKYWLAEIKDGDTWKPYIETKKVTVAGEGEVTYNMELVFKGDANVDAGEIKTFDTIVDSEYKLTAATKDIQIRILAVSGAYAEGEGLPVEIGDGPTKAQQGNPVTILVGNRTSSGGEPVLHHTMICVVK